jgi:hypothetical protein
MSLDCGVGQPKRSVSDVRRAAARSRERHTPEGVTHSFQVSLYKVEPEICATARNLFASDLLRLALLDKPLPSGPKVPLVSKPISFACRAERLAWAATGPDRMIVGPSGAAQRIAPDADAGEEVALNKSGKVGWSNVTNVPFVHDAGSDVARSDKLAQPGRGEWINLVVEGGPRHLDAPSC